MRFYCVLESFADKESPWNLAPGIMVFTCNDTYAGRVVKRWVFICVPGVSLCTRLCAYVCAYVCVCLCLCVSVPVWVCLLVDLLLCNPQSTQTKTCATRESQIEHAEEKTLFFCEKVWNHKSHKHSELQRNKDNRELSKKLSNDKTVGK